MTQEEKQLLLKDLCARLPYGVKINHIIYNWEGTCINFNRKLESFAIEKDNKLCYDVPIEEIRPYLRPMSSMTSEEKNTFEFFVTCNTSDTLDSISWANIQNLSIVRDSCDFIDWLNAHHFDHRGLIPMGLALEAPKDMYKTE